MSNSMSTEKPTPATDEYVPDYPNWGFGGGSHLEMQAQNQWERLYGPAVDSNPVIKLIKQRARLIRERNEAQAKILPSSCSSSHPEIRYTGDRCPLCEAGILAHLRRQREWSEQTFGPGPRTKGVIDHIRKELAEIEADPTDISEWIDVTILALDGAWRAGHSPEQIWEALKAKQAKNEARVWPDWRKMPTDKAIEHDRTADAALSRPSSAPGEKPSGLKCLKVPHIGTGHLHGEEDDRPYDVDGVLYCGRCHAWAPSGVCTNQPASGDGEVKS